MFHSNDRRSMRQTFSTAWSRKKLGQAMSDLERQIAAVIEWHPEYHPLVEDDKALEKDFAPEDGQINPFLHMGLHLGVRDQLSTDRPAGIRDVFTALREAVGDEHGAEHILLERLGEALWRAQSTGEPPDEASYLNDLRAEVRRRTRQPPGGL